MNRTNHRLVYRRPRGILVAVEGTAFVAYWSWSALDAPNRFPFQTATLDSIPRVLVVTHTRGKDQESSQLSERLLYDQACVVCRPVPDAIDSLRLTHPGFALAHLIGQKSRICAVQRKVNCGTARLLLRIDVNPMPGGRICATALI